MATPKRTEVHGSDHRAGTAVKGNERVTEARPRIHATGEVHGVKPLIAEPRGDLGRTVTGPADAHDALRPIDLIDTGLDSAHRNVQGSRGVPKTPFLVLTNIEHHHGRITSSELRCRRVGVDLGDGRGLHHFAPIVMVRSAARTAQAL